MADNNSRELSSAELEALMISELPTQATANETDLFEVAIVDQNSASGYASKKESAAAIADAIVGSYQYPLRITGTTAKTIAGAINELKNLVDLLPQFAIEVVNTLPVSDISETTIYLVPASDPEQGNYYEEYIYVNNAWELVGTTAVDLSAYYTSAQVDTLLAAKANSADLATVATSGAYSDLGGKPTIDTALDTTSTNAVENRAVASAINEIADEISSSNTTDNEPYLLRDSASGTADRMVDELVGGTVAWNQLVKTNSIPSKTDVGIVGTNNGDGTYTINGLSTGTYDAYYFVPSYGKGKYLVRGCPQGGSATTYRLYFGGKTDIGNGLIYDELSNSGRTLDIIVSNGVNVDNVVFKPQIFNLTKMFGSTIADYIYSLEQATAGAGVAFFRNLFPDDYYAYNAGELMSVKATAHKMRDASDNVIGNYPLDANLELRGLFKLDAKYKLYCDGDIYESSGKVTRKYNIVNLGSLTWELNNSYSGLEGHYRFNSLLVGLKRSTTIRFATSSMFDVITLAQAQNGAVGIIYDVSPDITLRIETKDYSTPEAFKAGVNGVYLVYELATPTTETAASFAGIQVVDGDGTEEYVDSRAVPIPVGHNTTYIHGLDEYRTAVESYLASLDARIAALENASSNRSLNVSQSLERSVISPIETRTEEITPEEENAVTSDSDTTEGKTEETEEETKEEAQKNER